MQHGRDMDKARGENEIVDLIVEQLRPLQHDEAYTRRVIAGDIAQLQERPPTPRGADIRQSAEKISSALAVLVSELERTRDPVLHGLGLLYGRDEFTQLQDACDRLIAHKPRSANFDDVQRACAIFAYHLVAGLSQKAPSGYAEGSFVNTASLLYEAISEKPYVDLRRHCLDELRVRKQKGKQPQT
jgi:hypothetical protein